MIRSRSILSTMWRQLTHYGCSGTSCITLWWFSGLVLAPASRCDRWIAAAS
ncbi:hypothetical protein R2601_04433 [Salipiger bermudensis HTCC2601]|uniref:Uncharacterized protein n=1 Tax=Salipiger bermudensis (strain DSM 26914 / JCM 13377 / KCTC 12554 / HTCC2601) TaxID=314265 RepID=Q0FVV9_SALBH|nr:hypothetical protein R2601_04433 [Salipiger bermudensis HTCC2601]